MDFYRQAAYFLAFLAFAAAAVLTLLDFVTPLGRFVQLAVLSGLALVAFGLLVGSLDEEG